MLSQMQSMKELTAMRRFHPSMSFRVINETHHLLAQAAPACFAKKSAWLPFLLLKETIVASFWWS
jgi:hypothetical protein